MSNDLIPLPESNGEGEGKTDRFLDPSQPLFWCSIPSDTPEGKALTWYAREGPSEQAADLLNQEVIVANLLLHPIQVTDQSGEVIDLIRAVMIDPAGKCVASSSTGIVNSLRTACQIFGRPPWDPGLRFTVIQISTKSKNRMYKLMPAVMDVRRKGTKK